MGVHSVFADFYFAEEVLALILSFNELNLRLDMLLVLLYQLLHPLLLAQGLHFEIAVQVFYF